MQAVSSKAINYGLPRSESFEEILNSVEPGASEVTLHVIFSDEAEVRLTKHSSGKQRLLMTERSNFLPDLRALNDVVSRNPKRRLSYGFSFAETAREEDLTNEQEYYSNLAGINVPNRGSMIDVVLDATDVSVLRGAVSSIVSSPLVAAVQLARPMAISSPKYYMPSSDRYYPTGTGWDTKDYNNPITMGPSEWDPGQPANTWWFNRHSIGWAWAQVGRGSSNIKVAVVDNGFDTGHEEGPTYDLAYRKGFWKNIFNITQSNTDVGWQSGTDGWVSHGTMVAHFVGAKADNGLGVSGVAPGVKVVPIKVTGKTISDGIDYARGVPGVRVINVSWGLKNGKTLENDYWCKEAMRRAYFDNIVVVNTAGNLGVDSPYNPDIYTHALTVSAIGNQSHAVAGPTTSGLQYGYGTRVDVTAAGDNITQSGISDGAIGSPPVGAWVTYSAQSGTSFAAPIVAGAAALVLTANPALNVLMVRDLIIHTSDFSSLSPVQMGNGLESGGNINSVAKVRVLNAGAAVLVTLNNLYNRNTVYVGNHDDEARYFSYPGYWLDEGLKYLIGVNGVANYGPSSGTHYVRIWNNVGRWTGGVSGFHASYCRNWLVQGVSELRAADGTFITLSANGGGDETTTGYRADYSVPLYP